jgi:hypothetical protein
MKPDDDKTLEPAEGPGEGEISAVSREAEEEGK